MDNPNRKAKTMSGIHEETAPVAWIPQMADRLVGTRRPLV